MRNSNYKLIFTGPVGAGKSSAIRAISDTPPVMTDATATDMTQNIKETTTVAMDYGTLQLEGGEHLHLYGTPGQERFSFMWDILTKGGIGLILLVDNTRPDPFHDLRFFLNSFKGLISSTQLAIGVTQMDRCASPPLEKYHEQMQSIGLKVPLFEVDARQRRDIIVLIEALLFSLAPNLKVSA